MSWRRVAAGALVATSTACSLLVPVPTDEYSNGARPDGGSGSPESGSSSSSGDSGPRPVSEGGACDATFCESFDDGPLGAKWDTKTTNAGTLTLVSEAFSPPNALEMQLVEQSAAGTEREAFLAKSFPVPKYARCSLEVFVGPPVKSGNDYEVLSFLGKSGSTRDRAFVKIGPGGWTVRHELSGQSTVSSDPIPQNATDTWVQLTLDVELGKTATLSANGKTTSIALSAFPGDTMTLGLGETGDNDLAGYTLRLDDLACSFTP